MTNSLTFTVGCGSRPYAVLVLRDGLVTARMGRKVLRLVPLFYAVAWARSQSPQPDVLPQVRLVGRHAQA